MQRPLPRLWLPTLVRSSYSSFPLRSRGFCNRSGSLTCTRRITGHWPCQAEGHVCHPVAQTHLNGLSRAAVHNRLLCTQPGQPAGSTSEAATNSAFTWKGFIAAPWTTVKQQWANNRAVIKNYGKFAVVLYFTVYVCTLGVIYSAVHFEVIKGGLLRISLPRAG